MLRLLIPLILLLLAVGCASGPQQRDFNFYVRSGNCDAALALIEQYPEAYGGNAELLFAMDAAMVNMQCGRLDDAQKHFRRAEALADELWTESISRSATALVTNDYVTKYQGEDYERVMIHLMSAIGYLQTGDRDEALVEFRRLDTLLNLYNSKYQKKNVYKEDAFGRYLSGLLNEDDGALDDAFIDYYRAVETYREYEENYQTATPGILIDDLFRVAQLVDRVEDAHKLVPGYEMLHPDRQGRDAAAGRVVFIELTGEGPYKVEETVFIPTGQGPVTIAFPAMRMNPPICSSTRFQMRSGGDDMILHTVLVEDINRIAAKNLEDRKLRVVAATIARAVTKQLIIGGIASTTDDPNAQAAITAALNMMNLILERADTRIWQTLPGEIHMARADIPAGTYQLYADRCGERELLEPLVVRAGKTTYRVLDTRLPAVFPEQRHARH